MLSTFRRIAELNEFAFVHLNTLESGREVWGDKPTYFEEQRQRAESESDLPAIFCEFHSDFPDLSRCKNERGAVGIHIVRDPRDMLLSAVRFHLVSDEQWLHEPSEKFGGLTYQQQLTSFDTLEERVRFEIDHNMGRVIRKMFSFDRQGVFRDIRYEDLIVDVNMTLWHDISIYLGMQGSEIIRSLEVFWRFSIFGKMKELAQSGKHSHIFNGQPRQWQTQLTPSILDMIQGEFESEITGLGYELGCESDLCQSETACQA